jgi:hypothetical protein
VVEGAGMSAGAVVEAVLIGCGSDAAG